MIMVLNITAIYHIKSFGLIVNISKKKINKKYKVKLFCLFQVLYSVRKQAYKLELSTRQKI